MQYKAKADTPFFEDTSTQMKKTYKCLYNHDMGSIPQCLTPALTSCDQQVTRQQVQQFVRDVADTNVDAILCCPTMLRRVLWRSEIDPHWQKEAPLLADRDDEDPILARGDQSMYYRMHRYIMNGGDPVRDTFEAVKEAGMDFFISYRMNDWQYFELEGDSLLLDTFWLEHPHYRVGEFSESYPFLDEWSEPRVAKLENYLQPEVRKHYCDLFNELADLYDIDGIELDFMRSPLYFPPSQLQEGTQAMTEFVRSVRGILDRHGAQRGKHLSLCVSVPSTLELCSVVGLDMALWDKERLIDQVRVSPGYVASFDLAIEDFCHTLEHARIYGDLQGTWAVQKDIRGHRQTTPEIYETGAFNFLKRGADGIAFDNFTFTYPTVQGNWLKPGRTDGGCDPPLYILQHIGDADYLATRPKHYFIGCRNIGWRPEGIGRFPMMNRIETTMAIYDDILCGQFTSAVLRVVSGERCDDIKMEAQFNGVALSEFDHRGELFEPLTDDGLPNTDEVRHFRVPLDKVKTGDNALCIETRDTPRPVEFIAVELALYVD